MSVTSTYSRPIDDGEKFAMTMMCATCGEFRTFILQANLDLILEKRWSAINIHAQCVKCQHMIDITLGWHHERKGYSSEPISLVGKVASVTDDVGIGGKHSDAPTNPKV